MGCDRAELPHACVAQLPAAGRERIAGIEDVIDNQSALRGRAGEAEMLDPGPRAALARPHDRAIHARGPCDGYASINGTLVGRDERDIHPPRLRQRARNERGR